MGEWNALTHWRLFDDAMHCMQRQKICQQPPFTGRFWFVACSFSPCPAARLRPQVEKVPFHL